MTYTNKDMQMYRKDRNLTLSYVIAWQRLVM